MKLELHVELEEGRDANQGMQRIELRVGREKQDVLWRAEILTKWMRADRALVLIDGLEKWIQAISDRRVGAPTGSIRSLETPVMDYGQVEEAPPPATWETAKDEPLNKSQLRYALDLAEGENDRLKTLVNKLRAENDAFQRDVQNLARAIVTARNLLDLNSILPSPPKVPPPPPIAFPPGDKA